MPKARSLRQRPRQATRPPPRQARSKDLYEPILDATLQVLMAPGWKTLTTTRVADRLDLQAALESMRNTSYEKLGAAFLNRKE